MYGQIIADQECKGFIERVNDFKIHQAHYIPHRPVRKASDTTPIRIVYDCSCKQLSQHSSLNDCLHIGSPFLNHLCVILLRFRQYVYAFSADIEKVFLHAEIALIFFGFLTCMIPTAHSNLTNSRWYFLVLVVHHSC